MTISVQKSLEEIVGYLRTLRRPVVDLFQPNVPLKALRGVFEDFGLTPPDDLIDLYSCYNGTKVIEGDVLDDLHLFPGFYWLSLEDASNSYKAFYRDTRWDRAWFPVFGNGGGDFYAVICDKNSPNFGRVIGFMLGEGEHPIEFESISIMLQAINRCYAEGAYFLKGGYLEANDYEMTRIARALNPELAHYSARGANS